MLAALFLWSRKGDPFSLYAKKYVLTGEITNGAHTLIFRVVAAVEFACLYGLSINWAGFVFIAKRDVMILHFHNATVVVGDHRFSSF